LSNTFSILIICSLHQRMQSLHALVSSLDQSNVITITDFSSPWAAIQKRPPHILIVDNCFSGFAVKDLLTQVKEVYPQTRRILLDDAFLDEQLLTHNLADAILKSDLPASYLLNALHQQMLILQENDQGTK
jgi:hypothetical protein